MDNFRQIASRINQQVLQLEARGVAGEPELINAMMGCVPELHQIWTGATDQQLRSLTEEFPGFYR